jgi:hypothetical protein
MTKAEIVKSYCEQYQSFPSLTLARLIYKENVAAFKDLEDARSSVRYVRGKRGADNKAASAGKYGYLHENEERTKKSPFALPESWAEPKKVFKLPTQCDNIGFISDHQVPFHDVTAIETCYKYLKDKGVNTIFINGDFVDFYGISSFLRDPKKRDFEAEYYDILQSLEHLRSWFPTENIYYNLDCNHEIRLERFMSYKAPELLKIKIPDFSFERLFKLDLFGIKPLKGNNHCLIGKLPIVHGHQVFVGQTSPASPARTVFMKTKKSCIASHCHQTSEYSTKTISDELITTWTTGCLMNLNVEYNPVSNNYNHGFARIETDKDGTYRVENKRIFNGKVL